MSPPPTLAATADVAEALALLLGADDAASSSGCTTAHAINAK